MPLPMKHCVVDAALLRGWRPWLQFDVAYPPWRPWLLRHLMVVAVEAVEAAAVAVEGFGLAM